MSEPSDAQQRAAMKVAIRAIKFNERPRPAERDYIAATLEYIDARIEKAEQAKKAKKAESQ